MSICERVAGWWQDLFRRARCEAAHYDERRYVVHYCTRTRFHLGLHRDSLDRSFHEERKR